MAHLLETGKQGGVSVFQEVLLFHAYEVS